MKQLLRLSIFLVLTIPFAAHGQQRSVPRPIEHDNPAAWEAYDLSRLHDPATGEIPIDAAFREREFAKTLPKHDPFTGTSSAPIFNWLPIGPNNVSGRVQAVALDIKNEANMLAGNASGGVWRSIDSGASWVKTTPPNEVQSISAIVQDIRAGKEATWYYSTSELLSTTSRRETQNIRTHTFGNGIYKSTNNGASWNIIASTHSTNSFSAPIEFRGIWNLALDTKNTSQDIMYAACYGGIMRSSDGGASWTNVLGNDSIKCFNSEIFIGKSGALYAAIGSTYDGTKPPHYGIWRSSDGITWTNISSNSLPQSIRRSRLAASASSDSIVYFLTENPVNWTSPDTSFDSEHSLARYIYRSGNGSGAGGTWEQCEMPFDPNFNNNNSSLSGYALILGVDPLDVNGLFIGGMSLFYSQSGCILDDTVRIGGYTNTQIGALHSDMHAITFSRKHPERIFIGCDGGVQMSYNFREGDGSWLALDNMMSSTQVYHSSLDHGTPGSDLIVSGMQDNYSWATTTAFPSDPWVPAGYGDGMTTAVLDGGSIILTSSQYGAIYEMIVNGQDVTYSSFLTAPASNQPNFFTNYIIEPNNNTELYEAITDELWRFDGLPDISSGNWTEIPQVRSALRPRSEYISCLAFSTSTVNRMFFGTNSGRIYQINNANSSPGLKEITGSGFPKNAFLAGIDVDPLDANHIIAVFSNYNIQSIFRTTNGGSSWTAIGGNLEQNIDGTGSGPSVRCAKILHRTVDTVFYVGTSVGLFSTTKIDGANTIWSQEGKSSIGDLIVESIDARQSDETMVISTQGGGIFKNIVPEGISSVLAATNDLVVEQNYPNPFRNNSEIRFMLGTPATLRVELYNTLGEKLSTVADSHFDAGSHIIDLSAAASELPTGNYFLRFISGAAVKTRMISISK